MPQLFKVVDNKESPQDPPEPTVETSSALWRLKSMMGSTAPSVVEDAPAPDVAAGELDVGTNDEDAVTSDEETVAPSHTSEEGTDEMRRAAAPEPAGADEVVPSRATPSDLQDGAIPTDGVPIAPTADGRDAIAAFRAAVGQAQEQAETQLLAVVELVRQESSEAHAAELAQVTEAADTRREQAVAEARAAAAAESARALEERERHYDRESRQARDDMQAEIAAAIDQVRREAAERHGAELAQAIQEVDTRQERAVADARAAAEAKAARVCDEIERQYLDDLQRAGNAVVESFHALTVRIREEA